MIECMMNAPDFRPGYPSGGVKIGPVWNWTYALLCAARPRYIDQPSLSYVAAAMVPDAHYETVRDVLKKSFNTGITERSETTSLGRPRTSYRVREIEARPVPAVADWIRHLTEFACAPMDARSLTSVVAAITGRPPMRDVQRLVADYGLIRGEHRVGRKVRATVMAPGAVIPIEARRITPEGSMAGFAEAIADSTAQPVPAVMRGLWELVDRGDLIYMHRRGFGAGKVSAVEWAA